ncbi:MAG: HEPN domain-containing protein [Anaerolineales bacterium]|nr:HEPN domain-containing protein [Anaerolineales bacterium]
MIAKRLQPDNPREWLNRAKSSFVKAQYPAEGVYLEDLCFDAQQAAEKAIKSILIFHQIRFPYIHDLAELIRLVVETGELVPENIYRAASLTRFAVSMRYPGVIEPVTMDEYQEALKIAKDVIVWAEEIIEHGSRKSIV